MQVRAIANFPVPDFSADTSAGEHARTVARDNIEELSALRLQPVAYSFRDTDRHRIDEVTLEMLGLDGDDSAARAVRTLRNQLCREPLGARRQPHDNARARHNPITLGHPAIRPRYSPRIRRTSASSSATRISAVRRPERSAWTCPSALARSSRSACASASALRRPSISSL